MIVSENSVIPRDDSGMDSGDETRKCKNTMRSSVYKLNTYPAYANLISGVAGNTNPQAAGAGPQFFGFAVKTDASPKNFGVSLNVGLPFFKSSTSNEVYCTGATEGSTEVDVSCFFFGQDAAQTAHFGSATAVNSVSGMLVYKIRKPASSNVQIVTPIQTKAVDGTAA